MPSFHPDTVHLGLDVHKDSISAAILNPGHESPDCEKVFHDEESVRRLIGRLGDPRLVRACYEAGPTGYTSPASCSRWACAVRSSPPR